MLAKVFLQKISCRPDLVLTRALFYLMAFDLSSRFMVLQIQPRKQNLTLYILHGNQDNPALEKLGKHKTSSGGMGGCLYINKLSDVDQKVLRKLIETSFRAMKKTAKQ